MSKNISKKKTYITIGLTLLLITVFLSGCIGPRDTVTTIGWGHANKQGTAVVLHGTLTPKENNENWKEGFVWDVEYHEDWSEYENLIWADDFGSYNSFSAELYNLNRSDSFHFRAIAEKTQSGEVQQGEDKVFKSGLPSISTDNSDYNTDSAVANGILEHLGGAANCTVWFEYGISKNNLNFDTIKEVMNETGEFSSNIHDLFIDKKYYYRAVTENDIGLRYGSIRILKDGYDHVETKNADNIGITSATLNGRLNNMTSVSSAQVWFKYGNKSANNLDEQTFKLIMTNPGDFSITLSYLEEGTTYWFQAVANINGTNYFGDVDDFTTLGS